MKRIAPILGLVLLIIAGVIAFNHYKTKPTVASLQDASTPAAPESLHETAGEATEFKTLAATLPIPEVNVELLTYWKKVPTLEDEGFLKIEVRDAATKEPVEAPGALTVSVWSATHSYGLVQPSVTPVLDQDGKPVLGSFKVSRIFFLAPDQWEVRIYLKQEGAKQITQTMNIDLGQPAPNPMTDPNSPTSIMMKGMGMDHTVNHNRAKEIADAKKKRNRESVLKDPKAREDEESHEGHN